MLTNVPSVESRPLFIGRPTTSSLPRHSPRRFARGTQIARRPKPRRLPHTPPREPAAGSDAPRRHAILTLVPLSSPSSRIFVTSTLIMTSCSWRASSVLLRAWRGVRKLPRCCQGGETQMVHTPPYLSLIHI